MVYQLIQPINLKLKKKMTNEQYVEKRNKLIPEAERYANSLSPGKWRSATEEWNKLFLGKMNELAREKGLVN